VTKRGLPKLISDPDALKRLGRSWVVCQLCWRFQWPCDIFHARFGPCPSLQTHPNSGGGASARVGHQVAPRRTTSRGDRAATQCSAAATVQCHDPARSRPRLPRGWPRTGCHRGVTAGGRQQSAFTTMHISARESLLRRWAISTGQSPRTTAPGAQKR
jgi:hypothetical protein